MTFHVKEGDTFYSSWERYKDLLQACPHHAFELWRVISFFHDALPPSLKQFVEMMSQGEFMNKSPQEAFDYFDFLAESAQLWDNSNSQTIESNTPPGTGGRYNISKDDELEMKISNLTRNMEVIERRATNNVS